MEANLAMDVKLNAMITQPRWLGLALAETGRTVNSTSMERKGKVLTG